MVFLMGFEFEFSLCWSLSLYLDMKIKELNMVIDQSLGLFLYKKLQKGKKK